MKLLSCIENKYERGLAVKPRGKVPLARLTLFQLALGGRKMR